MKPTIEHRPVKASKLNVRHRKAAQHARLADTALLPGNGRCVDGRSAWARRVKSLLESWVSDLAGWDSISTGEAAILRHAVVLCIELDRRAQAFARAAQINDQELAVYMTGINNLRRCAETLGLSRRMRDVGPTLGDLLREDILQQQREQQDNSQ